MLELRKHVIYALLACAFATPTFAQQTTAGLKVAFTGDQSLGSDPEEVLRLVLAEGAEALFIQGDFDYSDDPAAWEAMLTAVLGPDFPVIALVGNHDEAAWYGAGGYQDRLAQRMQRTGVSWLGELGVQATVNYKGLFVVQTSAGVFDGYDHAAFIRKSLADDASIWSVSGWHKLMSDMQVGGKGDETGWEVYEESRRGGAIIATAHEHSYSRTHLLSNMENRTVASTAQPLVLAADDAGTSTDEGRSFAFVSGLGGSSIRDQERSGDWWASVYTSTQGASNGALFAVFNVDGDPRLARFYFKDVTGKLVDDFMVRSALGQEGAPPPTPTTTTTTVPTATSTTTTTSTVPTATSTSTTTTAPAATSTSTTSTTAPATNSTSTTSTTGPATSSTSTTAPPTPVPTPPPAPGSACSDNVDNDGDKRIDYPEDKGCDSPDDPYEQGRKHTRRLLRKQGTVLPPATMAPLGACWDGVDNDDDRRADYPKDKGCDSPDDPYELNRPQTKRLLEGLE
jgi:hypothetical protein